jgi:hypothetical protein
MWEKIATMGGKRQGRKHGKTCSMCYLKISNIYVKDLTMSINAVDFHDIALSFLANGGLYRQYIMKLRLLSRLLTKFVPSVSQRDPLNPTGQEHR